MMLFFTMWLVLCILVMLLMLSSWSQFVKMLLCFEVFVVVLLLFLTLNMQCNVNIVIFFLFVSVMEAILGMSILISFVRVNSTFYSSSMMWYDIYIKVYNVIFGVVCN